MVRTRGLIAPVLFLAAAIVGCATGTDGGGGDPSGTGTPGGSSDDGGPAASSDSGGGGTGNTSDGGGGGGNTDSGSGGGTDSGGGGSCSDYADPTTKANCIDTQYCGGSKLPACNANGCDGSGSSAYWCQLSTKKCVKKPSGC